MLELLQSTIEDIREIESHNPDHAARLFKKIAEWEDHIQWGRVPRNVCGH